MDIAEFATIRPARPAQFDRVVRPLTEITVSRPGGSTPGSETHVPQPIWLTADNLPGTLGDTAMDPLTTPAETVLGKIFTTLREISAALVSASDRLTGQEVADLVAKAASASELDSVEWPQVFDQPVDGATQPAAVPDFAWALADLVLGVKLREAMTAGGAEPQDFDGAVRLTRLALVARMLGTVTDDDTSSAVFDLLQRRSLVLTDLPAESINKTPKIALVRETTTRDLQVVRREWAGYLPGEVANVRNVMAGESFSQHDLTTRENETTASRSSDRTESSETSSESKQVNELTSSITNALGLSINGHVDASVDIKYPVVTAHIGGSVDAGLTMQRTDQLSSKIAREAVARATSRVDSLTRESRVERELLRNEQGYDYALKNPGTEHLHAVYRWVDRVDTYQMFRYTDRLLLEFQIPEPAEFFRWRTGRAQAAATATERPPEWTVTATDISPENLVTLATQYRATNLPAPPDETLVVVRTVSVESTANAGGAGGAGDQYSLPTAAKEVDLPIPPDYVSEKIAYSGEGIPVVGQFKDPEGRDTTGIRAAYATVAVGASSDNFFNGGYRQLPNGNLEYLATHSDVNDIGSIGSMQLGPPPFGRALLPIGVDAQTDPVSVEIAVPGVQTVLKAAVTTAGLSICTVTFALTCTLTESATQRWQLSVLDALFTAWQQWKRDYEAQQTRAQLMGQTVGADAGNTQRNDQVIREELKRELISWLLEEDHFLGRPGLLARPVVKDVETDFGDVDRAEAIRTAADIQWLEQAFEWSNLAWVFYPYFWAARAKWETLSQVQADDPEFERFLKAGSARVILPARPAFENAVSNWLLTGVPYINGQLPKPDDPLYVSIDTEVREILNPQDGGVPGDHWQTRLSTTMLYLEKEGDLPFVNSSRRLPAEVGVPYQPGDLIPLDGPNNPPVVP